MSEPNDRLYNLLPAVYRIRDVDHGLALQALLRVIAEQVDVVEADIERLYENWFVETAEEWVVPYIGDLIGHRPVYEAGEPGGAISPQERQRSKVLISRREVANTIRYRRRKGALALLELLAHDVAVWPARAVEFFQLLGVNQAVRHLRLRRGQTLDLRLGDALDRLDGPFDDLAHTVDVHRISSHRGQDRYNIPSVGLFVWRLKAYSVTETPAYCAEEVGAHCYTFSVLGNDAPLYVRPVPEPEPTTIAGELNLPIPIRRRALERQTEKHYGPGKSVHILVGARREPVPADHIVAANLADWQYRPRRGSVAVDPVLGRIAFPPGELPSEGVWVVYHYGFSADIGGGEYDRPFSHPEDYVLYPVGEQENLKSIGAALARWQDDLRQGDPQRTPRLRHAVIEITDSGVYVEQINIALSEGHSLQVRAANRRRPVIRLLDWQTGRPDALTVTCGRRSRFTLDGLLVTGRGVRVMTRQEDRVRQEAGRSGDLADVAIRHSTLVPGWGLAPDCAPQRPAEPSLSLFRARARVDVDHSIIGSIQVSEDEVRTDPIQIHIRDSVLDATSAEREALGAPGWPVAHAVLTVLRSTVFGRIQAHAIDLAENSIFDGRIMVARRQRGCMRFCYVTPGSRTPRRYNCQPDMVEQAVTALVREGRLAPEAQGEALAGERLRVRPQFTRVRYGTPAYCQLSRRCAVEIRRGADDQSEMGVFHDLFQPQREANLRTRLEEYTPAGTDVGILFAS